jgi:hypothetical protein
MGTPKNYKQILGTAFAASLAGFVAVTAVAKDAKADQSTTSQNMALRELNGALELETLDPSGNSALNMSEDFDWSSGPAPVYKGRLGIMMSTDIGADTTPQAQQALMDFATQACAAGTIASLPTDYSNGGQPITKQAIDRFCRLAIKRKFGKIAP